MRPLEDFLGKIKKTILKEQILKEDIIFVIKKETGIELLKESIHNTGRKIKISSHPAIKNDIFLKKERILSSLKEKGIFVEGII